MMDQRSIVRLTLVGFVAAGAREVALLPSRIARKTSWLSWLSSAAIGVIAELTTDIGLVISSLFGPRSHGLQGFLRIGKARMPKVVEPAVVPSAPKLADTPAKRPRPAATIDRSLVDRKLWLLSRSGLFGEDTKGARIERACTLEDLRKAYKLVHDVYLGTGFIEPEPAGMRLRIFEMTPDMATFVAKVDGRVVGVLSVLEDTSELGLPSDSAFREELDALRAAGKRLCEITNQAVAQEFRKSAVPTELMRCAVAHLTIEGFDQAIATVSPSHGSFYDLSGFREFGSERSYSTKLHDPVVALSMDIGQFRKPPGGLNETERFINNFLGAANHFLPHVKEWAKEAQRHFLDAELLAQLFVTERNFLAECSPAELEVLQGRWGHELFSEVTGDLFMPSMEKLVEAALPRLADCSADRAAA